MESLLAYGSDDSPYVESGRPAEPVTAAARPSAPSAAAETGEAAATSASGADASGADASGADATAAAPDDGSADADFLLAASRDAAPPAALLVDMELLRELPPEPAGAPNAELVEKIRSWRAQSFNPTANIKRNKEFGNPQILQKVADHFEIDDIASGYPKSLFDPHGYEEREFIEALSRGAAPGARRERVVLRYAAG